MDYKTDSSDLDDVFESIIAHEKNENDKHKKDQMVKTNAVNRPIILKSNNLEKIETKTNLWGSGGPDPLSNNLEKIEKTNLGESGGPDPLSDIKEENGILKITLKTIHHILTPSSFHLTDTIIKGIWPIQNALFQIGMYKLIGNVRVLDMDLFNYTITAKLNSPLETGKGRAALWRVHELKHSSILITKTNWKTILEKLLTRHKFQIQESKTREIARKALNEKPLSTDPIEWLKEQSESGITWASEVYNGSYNADFLTEHSFPGLLDLYPLHVLRSLTMLERGILFDRMKESIYGLFFYDVHLRIPLITDRFKEITSGNIQNSKDKHSIKNSNEKNISQGGSVGPAPLIQNSKEKNIKGGSGGPAPLIPLFLPAIDLIHINKMYNSDQEIKQLLASLSMSEFLSIWFYHYIQLDQSLSNDTASLFYESDFKIIFRNAYPTKRVEFNNTYLKMYRLLFPGSKPRFDIPYFRSFENFLNNSQAPIIKNLVKDGYLIKSKRPIYSQKELDEKLVLIPECKHAMVFKHWNQLTRHTKSWLKEFHSTHVSNEASIEEARTLVFGPLLEMLESRSGTSSITTFEEATATAHEKMQFEIAKNLHVDQLKVFENFLKLPITMVNGGGGVGKSLCNRLFKSVREEKTPTSTIHAIVAARAASTLEEKSCSGYKNSNTSSFSAYTLAMSGQGTGGQGTRQQVTSRQVTSRQVTSRQGINGRGELKTSIENLPIAAYQKKSTIIIFTPTNRVANRTADKCQIDSVTLPYTFEYLMHNSPDDRYDELRKSGLEEISLMGELSFHRFIHMVKHFPRLIRLFFMGDHMQLPSVDPGNVIHDLRRMSFIPCQVLTKNHRISAEAPILAACMAAINKQDFIALKALKQAGIDSGQFQVVRYDCKETHRKIYQRYDNQDPATFQFLSYRTEIAHEANVHYLLNSGMLDPSDLPIKEYRTILPFFFVGEKISPKDNVNLPNGVQFDRLQPLQVLRIVDIIKSNNSKRDISRTDEPFSVDFADNSRSQARFIELKDLLSGNEYSIEWKTSMISLFQPSYACSIHSFQGEQCEDGEVFIDHFCSNLVLKVAVGRFQKSCRVHILCRPYFDPWDDLAVILQRQEPLRLSALGL